MILRIDVVKKFKICIRTRHFTFAILAYFSTTFHCCVGHLIGFLLFVAFTANYWHECLLVLFVCFVFLLCWSTAKFHNRLRTSPSKYMSETLFNLWNVYKISLHCYIPQKPMGHPFWTLPAKNFQSTVPSWMSAPDHTFKNRDFVFLLRGLYKISKFSKNGMNSGCIFDGKKKIAQPRTIRLLADDSFPFWDFKAQAAPRTHH